MLRALSLALVYVAIAFLASLVFLAHSFEMWVGVMPWMVIPSIAGGVLAFIASPYFYAGTTPPATLKTFRDICGIALPILAFLIGGIVAITTSSEDIPKNVSESEVEETVKAAPKKPRLKTSQRPLEEVERYMMDFRVRDLKETHHKLNQTEERLALLKRSPSLLQEPEIITRETEHGRKVVWIKFSQIPPDLQFYVGSILTDFPNQDSTLERLWYYQLGCRCTLEWHDPVTGKIAEMHSKWRSGFGPVDKLAEPGYIDTHSSSEWSLDTRGFNNPWLWVLHSETQIKEVLGVPDTYQKPLDLIIKISGWAGPDDEESFILRDNEAELAAR